MNFTNVAQPRPQGCSRLINVYIRISSCTYDPTQKTWLDGVVEGIKEALRLNPTWVLNSVVLSIHANYYDVAGGGHTRRPPWLRIWFNVVLQGLSFMKI